MSGARRVAVRSPGIDDSRDDNYDFHLVTERMMEHVVSGNFAFGGALALLDKDAS